MTTIWQGATFEGAKRHVVTTALLPETIRDLRSRGHHLSTQDVDQPNPRLLGAANLDMGGPWLQGAPVEVFTLDDLWVHVPSGHVDIVLRGCAKAPQRTFTDGSPYYKVHGRYTCLVLTPDQHARFAALLAERAEVAWARDVAHFEQWKASADARNREI